MSQLQDGQWSQFAGSLAARLTLGALAWVGIALLVTGLALTELYRQSALRGLDRELAVLLDGLTASVDLDSSGAPTISGPPNDPRFLNAASGRYWQVTQLDLENGRRARSESLWDEALTWPENGEALARTPGMAQVRDAAGPYGQPVRLSGQVVALNGGKARLLILAAFDRREAESDVDRFRAMLFWGLATLGAGLILAAALQVRFGLRPLQRLRSDIAAVRDGRTDHLTGDYPTEVAPLTKELNALLAHNAEVVERARTHVGNLAHALKTPLSVILNETRGKESPALGVVHRNAEAMAANIDHYLKRAQAAARAETLGARTDVTAALNDITRMLEKLYGQSKDLDLVTTAQSGLQFRGERQDFDEMAGNLMENACKYGDSAVRVTASLASERLVLVVEDDGPGLPEDKRAIALARGQRLDETAPGAGLGLSIVAELASMYGGTLALSDSDLGGLKAVLELPSAT